MMSVEYLNCGDDRIYLLFIFLFVSLYFVYRLVNKVDHILVGIWCMVFLWLPDDK